MRKRQSGNGKDGIPNHRAEKRRGCLTAKIAKIAEREKAAHESHDQRWRVGRPSPPQQAAVRMGICKYQEPVILLKMTNGICGSEFQPSLTGLVIGWSGTRQ
jgi:hypothetical protein